MYTVQIIIEDRSEESWERTQAPKLNRLSL